MAGKGLSDRQKRFIDAYLTCWNASEAARQAGYSKKTARFIGSENLTKPNIRAAIDARLADMRMGANEVLARLSAHASGTLTPFIQVSGENAFVDLTTDEAKANLHLIKEIETERRTYGKEENPVEEFRVKLKIHDPQAALVQLGRYHKLFVDRVDSTTWNIDFSKLTDEQLDRLAAGEDPRAVLARQGEAAPGAPEARVAAESRSSKPTPTDAAK